jgi:putative Mg2+ transporter-C (MgtC) family protein
MNWLKTLQQFNEISVVIRILLAMILGGCIGLEREKNKRPAGFRTHILVCVGACMTALIGLFVWNKISGTSDPLRISAQVISGIGFLGVGTILVKEHDHITGLTTAAGLWATATIGIACGCGFCRNWHEHKHGCQNCNCHSEAYDPFCTFHDSSLLVN